jgi:hypothetical protein
LGVAAKGRNDVTKTHAELLRREEMVTGDSLEREFVKQRAGKREKGQNRNTISEVKMRIGNITHFSQRNLETSPPCTRTHAHVESTRDCHPARWG